MKRAKETNAKNGFSFISYMCVMDFFCSIFYIVKGWKMLTHITEQVNNEFWRCEGEGESARKRLSFNFFFFTYKQKKIGTYVRHRIWVLIIYPSIIMKFSRFTKKKKNWRKKNEKTSNKTAVNCLCSNLWRILVKVMYILSIYNTRLMAFGCHFVQAGLT